MAAAAGPCSCGPSPPPCAPRPCAPPPCPPPPCTYSPCAPGPVIGPCGDPFGYPMMQQQPSQQNQAADSVEQPLPMMQSQSQRQQQLQQSAAGSQAYAYPVQQQSQQPQYAVYGEQQAMQQQQQQPVVWATQPTQAQQGQYLVQQQQEQPAQWYSPQQLQQGEQRFAQASPQWQVVAQNTEPASSPYYGDVYAVTPRQQTQLLQSGYYDTPVAQTSPPFYDAPYYASPLAYKAPSSAEASHSSNDTSSSRGEDREDDDEDYHSKGRNYRRMYMQRHGILGTGTLPASTRRTARRSASPTLQSQLRYQRPTSEMCRASRALFGK